MYDDARIARAFHALLAGIDVPEFSMRPVAPAQPRARLRRSPFVAAASAAVAAVAIALALPRVAPALTQSIETQIEALLHWKQPPPAPKAVWSAMRSVTVTLAGAQARVPFKIVVPAGLPEDVVSQKIYSAPPGVYSNATHSWSLGAPVVTFEYRRADGRSFSLMADRFDPHAEPPGKYMFEDMDRRANGREVILRRDKFTWRNGDQVMSAIADEGISDAEIAVIRTAMHGIAIPGVWRPGNVGPYVKQYRLP